MAAAPDVGGGGDRVGGFDRGRDRGRGRAGHAGLAFGDVLALSPGVSGAGVPVAGAGAPVVLAICSEIEARLSLSASSRDSSVSIAARRSAWADFSSAKRASASARAAATSLLLDRDRVARIFDLRAHGGHPLDRGARFVAQALDPDGDRVVVLLDLVEVVGAGVDFRPAGRVEHDVEHVGAARLVDRDEAFAQDAERALQAGAHRGQVALVGFELFGRARRVRPAWRRVRPRPRPAAGAAPRLRRSSSRSPCSVRRSSPPARSGSSRTWLSLPCVSWSFSSRSFAGAEATTQRRARSSAAGSSSRNELPRRGTRIGGAR